MAPRRPDTGAPVLTGPRPEDLMAVFPAVSASLPPARALLRQWLTGQAWPEASAEDVVLAVCEALVNVIDHAYPPTATGSAHLHAWVSVEPRTGARRVIAAVTDHGSWNPDHRATEHAGYRGHGLGVMSGCMAGLHIQRSARGTSIILTSAEVPAEPPEPVAPGTTPAPDPDRPR